MMHELGFALTPQSVASHYGGLLNGFVVDERDDVSQHDFQIPILRTRTVMTNLHERIGLARDILAFADTLSG